MKNLKLKKELPTISIDDAEFKLPIGTILEWNDDQECWGILDFGENNVVLNITEIDFNNNPSFFTLSTAKPTYPVFVIDDDQIEFYDGYISIGCQNIDNDTVRQICKYLKGKSKLPEIKESSCGMTPLPFYPSCA